MINEINNNDLIPLLHQVDTKKLPTQMQMLIDILGIENAYGFAKMFGGRAKYIPKNPQRSHLKYLIQDSGLENLCKEWGGINIDVPTAHHIDRQIRDIYILRELRNGKSRVEMAKKFKLGVRQITNIKNSTLQLR